jgi:hypothetical protein
MKRGFVIAAVTVLAACSSGASVVQTNADSVVVKYDSTYSNAVQAKAKAQEICAKDGRYADFGVDEYQGSDSHLVTFKCLK